MTTAVLKKNGQPFIEIPVPGGLHDIRLSAYIDFLVEAGKMGEEGTNPVLVMARAVSAFYSVPLADVLQIEAGDLDGEARRSPRWLRTTATRSRRWTDAFAHFMPMR